MKCRGFRKNIDAYLRNTLSAAMVEEFEAHYFQCDRCFTTLKIQNTLRKNDFLLRERKSENTKRFRTALISAASIVLVVGLGITFTQVKHRNYIERISGFVPPEFIISETRGLLSDQTYASALEAYSHADYSDALKKAESVPQNQRPPKIYFFIGINRLITGDEEGALAAFQWIIDQMEPSYFDEALFFKGIALLRCGKIPQAEQIFLHLSTMFSPMKEPARVRLNLIRENK